MRFALGCENGDKVDAAMRLLRHVKEKGSVPSLEAFHWALALRPRPQVALMLLIWFEEIDAEADGDGLVDALLEYFKTELGWTHDEIKEAASGARIQKEGEELGYRRRDGVFVVSRKQLQKMRAAAANFCKPKISEWERRRTILTEWLKSHLDNPYPTESQKQELMERTGLDKTQLSKWFRRARTLSNARQGLLHRLRAEHNEARRTAGQPPSVWEPLRKRGGQPNRARGLGTRGTSILTEWLKKNLDNPYLTHSEKQDWAARTGLDPLQVDGWLNTSRRLNGLHDRLLAARDAARLTVPPLETVVEGARVFVAAAGVFGVVERAGDMGVWVRLADGRNAGFTADELRDAGQVEAAVAAALGAGKRKQPEAPSTTPAPKKPRATPREDASTTVMAVAPPVNVTLAPGLRAVPFDVDTPAPTSRDKPIIIDDDDTPAPPAPTSLDKPIIIDDD